MRALELRAHPHTRGGPVRRVTARVQRTPQGALALAYVLEGDVGRLRVPPPGPPRIAERLWEHTCCEIFIARKGSPAYHEFNLSPSGEWAAYAFSRYREDMRPATEALDPRIRLRRAQERLELDALIDLPPLEGELMLGLAAVTQEQGGALSYWALRHPPGKPDFHHASTFACELR